MGWTASLLKEVQGLVAIGRRQHRMPSCCKQQAGHLTQRGIILDQQNCFGSARETGGDL